MKQIRILSFLSASAFYPFVGIRILSFFRIHILSFLSVRLSVRICVLFQPMPRLALYLNSDPS
jgi:hypothetical protein